MPIKQNDVSQIKLVGTVLATTILMGLSVWAVTTSLANDEKPTDKFVFCFDVVEHSDGSVGYTGHPPIDFPAQADEGDNLMTSECFETWAGAAEFITGGAVQLPDDASQQDYERATGEYSDKIYEEQQAQSEK